MKADIVEPRSRNGAAECYCYRKSSSMEVTTIKKGL